MDVFRRVDLCRVYHKEEFTSDNIETPNSRNLCSDRTFAIETVYE